MVKDKISIAMDRELLNMLRNKAKSRKPKVSLSWLIEYYVRLGIMWENKYGEIAVKT